MALVARWATATIERALSTFRVVVVNGPRQAGKSTLLAQLAPRIGADLVTLDDRTQLRAARVDPAGFVEDRGRPLFIDEVQRGGDPLVLAIKSTVDRDPAPGRFVLSGSSRFLTVPTLSESLAGRARIVDLWPLSQGEFDGHRETFVDRCFDEGVAGTDLGGAGASRSSVMERAVIGGFPAVRSLGVRDREDWFAAYRRTLVERDLLDLRRVRQVDEVADLIRVVSAWTAQELQVRSVARAAGLAENTTRDYLALLEAIYVVNRLPNWRPAFVAKALHRPKIHAVDTGLACDALGIGVDALVRPGSDAAGPVLETFVVNELTKQLGWSDARADIRHFRDGSGREVDVVLQDRSGRVVAVEVKAALDVDERDARWLAWLRDNLGERFVRGVVLHLGPAPVRLGDRLVALPVDSLWAA